MQIIKLGKSRKYNIEDDPTPGTYASLLMLLKQYIVEDRDYIDVEVEHHYMKKIIAHRYFIEEVLRIHGELHCEYCGCKLVQQPIDVSKMVKDCATVDHFYPILTHPHLEYTFSNFIISCRKHNNDKGTDIWCKSEIKFPYDNSMILPFKQRPEYRKMVKI